MRKCICSRALASIRGGNAYPKLEGTVKFFQKSNGLMVTAEIVGLPKTKTGFFSFHIHEGRQCISESFSDTGGHFNPTGATHPNHAGDLPTLLADHGKAYLSVFTDRFCIDEVIGRTVVIHSDPDDFRSEPSGNAGEKIACGVIKRVY